MKKRRHKKNEESEILEEQGRIKEVQDRLQNVTLLRRKLERRTVSFSCSNPGGDKRPRLSFDEFIIDNDFSFGASQIVSSSAPSSSTSSGFTMANSIGQTPLMIAARDGDETRVKRLLQYGADPGETDDRGYDSLMYAVRDGHCGVVKLLLNKIKQNANVSGMRGYGFRNRFGLSHILYASLNGHTQVVSILAQYGSKLDIGDVTGMTSLMGAAKNGHVDTVKALVNLGATIDMQDRHGLTALAWAVKEGMLPTVRALIELGANVKICDRKNRSPLLMAVALGLTEIGELLLSAGADICNSVRLAILRNHLSNQLPPPQQDDDSEIYTDDAASSSSSSSSSSVPLVVVPTNDGKKDDNNDTSDSGSIGDSSSNNDNNNSTTNSDNSSSSSSSGSKQVSCQA